MIGASEQQRASSWHASTPCCSSFCICGGEKKSEKHNKSVTATAFSTIFILIRRGSRESELKNECEWGANTKQTTMRGTSSFSFMFVFFVCLARHSSAFPRCGNNVRGGGRKWLRFRDWTMELNCSVGGRVELVERERHSSLNIFSGGFPRLPTKDFSLQPLELPDSHLRLTFSVMRLILEVSSPG